MFYRIFRAIIFLFYTVDFLLLTAITFTCAWLPGRFKQIMHRLFQRWCWAFLRFMGVEVHIHQKFNPPLPQQYVLISNHPSGGDILILNALFYVHPLAKYELQFWWIIGTIAKGIGSVFVKREDKESRRAAKQEMLDCVQEGKNLLIYPEGGCFGRHLRPFKYGAFDIAKASGIPILPVYLQYEAECDFEWGDYGLLHHVYNMSQACNKHAHCYIFAPISPEFFDDVESFCDYTHKMFEHWEAKYRLG